MIFLVKGYSDHNLYRYNWVWFSAFQAIALGCLRDNCSGRVVPPTPEGSDQPNDEVDTTVLEANSALAPWPEVRCL